MNKLFFVSSLILLVASGCGSSATKKGDSSKGNEFDSPKATSEDSASANEQGSDSGTTLSEDQSKRPEPTSVNKSTNPDLYKKFNQARGAHQTRAAQEAAGELLARNPGDPGVLNALSSYYIELEKYDLARLVITKVLEKNPSNGAALNNLGVVELRQGNLRLALINFKKAVEVDPANRFAHGNLGSIYLQFRNFSSAATELQAAVDHGEQSATAFSNLGFALAEIGRYDDAESAYEKALSKDSGNVTAMLNYAVLLIQDTDKKEKGIKLLNKVRFVAHEPAILEKVEALAKMAETRKLKDQDKGIQEKEKLSE